MCDNLTLFLFFFKWCIKSLRTGKVLGLNLNLYTRNLLCLQRKNTSQPQSRRWCWRPNVVQRSLQTWTRFGGNVLYRRRRRRETVNLLLHQKPRNNSADHPNVKTVSQRIKESHQRWTMMGSMASCVRHTPGLLLLKTALQHDCSLETAEFSSVVTSVKQKQSPDGASLTLSFKKTKTLGWRKRQREREVLPDVEVGADRCTHSASIKNEPASHESTSIQRVQTAGKKAPEVKRLPTNSLERFSANCYC